MKLRTFAFMGILSAGASQAQIQTRAPLVATAIHAIPLSQGYFYYEVEGIDMYTGQIIWTDFQAFDYSE